MPPSITHTSIPCPGCQQGLVALTDSGPEGRTTVLGGCFGCGGMWLDNAASRQLMDGSLSPVAREFVREVTVRSKGAKPADAPYRAAAAGRNCPVCASTLKATKLQNPSVQIDVCGAHGAYMDRGEVGSIWMETSVRAAELDAAAGDMQREVEAQRVGALLDALGVRNPLLRH